MDFTVPDNNLAHVGLDNGGVVADLGAGSGFYTIAAAKRVGGNGKVYAVEVQKELLDTISRRAEGESLTNIEVIWGDIDEVGGTKLKDASCDVVILSNVMFQLESPASTIKETKRILKSGGRVLVVDWTDSFGHMGPEPGAVMTPEKARPMFLAEGLLEKEQFGAGPHHWGIIFNKQ